MAADGDAGAPPSPPGPGAEAGVAAVSRHDPAPTQPRAARGRHRPSYMAPIAAAPVAAASQLFPETLRYRLKNVLLGPPKVTEQLSSERLGRPTALGVLAPDCISSSAYGTEQILTQMVPIVGLAAFTLVVPVTVAILCVLFFVTLSYLEVIQRYTKSGGAYVVARDNFGPKVAQVAAVALLIDYTVTVAVQTAAGTDALTSAFPALRHLTIEITVAVILILLFGNLRGIKEAGRYFALPTYLYVFGLGSVIVVGIAKQLFGTLAVLPLPPAHEVYGGQIGSPGSGLLMGLGFVTLLRVFANGGSSLTGLEAISNGVASFRPPEARNARITLVIMSSILAFLVMGVTLLARWTHAIPYAGGTPTVVSQEVRVVFGTSALGHLAFYFVQFATVAILYTGGNTSFNGFPYLASFVAGDSFLPRQLTKRGHRLVFSNGIIVLALLAVTLVLVFQATLTGLVALYAIGVFTGFTMAGSGMVKRHLVERGAHWRRGVFINGVSAVVCASVVLIFAFSKFTEGAWVVVVVGPLMYWGLIRLHREYAEEAQMLEVGAARAAAGPLLRRHVVVVLVDSLDMAAARTIRYVCTLSPDDLRAVHFDVDSAVTAELVEEWRRLGLSRLPLDIVECPDRRLARAAIELVADAVADGDTECTVLLPRRRFNTGWARLLHDQTADRISAVVSQVPHVSATIVPYTVHDKLAAKGRRYRRLLDRRGAGPSPEAGSDPGEAVTAEPVAGGGGASADDRRRGTATDDRTRRAVGGVDRALIERAGDTTAIVTVQLRHRVKVAGRVKSIRVQPRAGTSNLECVLTDGTGSILLVFQGRPKIPGIEPGARLLAEGMVGAWSRRQAILNPDYELVGGADHESTGGGE